jgi:Glycosyltransferase family 87
MISVGLPKRLKGAAGGCRGRFTAVTGLQIRQNPMHLYFNRPVAILLFAALAFVITVRGFVPAMSKIDSDFPGYFTAAKIVADGGDVQRLYDDSWFQDQMRHYQIGKPSEGKFAPFPPPTALLLVPLAHLEPLNALRVMTGVSVLCLVCAIVLLARILSRSLIDSAVFILLSGNAVIGALRLGQPYILVSLSCLLGYYAYVKGRPVLAGVFFGLFTPIKYFPVVILAYFAFRKEWKLVLGGATAILAVVLTSIGVLGWKIHEEFLSSVLGNHLVANMSMQDPFTASFQSFDTLFRRLFVLDERLNPQPWIALPRLQVIGVVLAKVSIFLAGIATLVKLARSAGGNAAAPSIGLLGVLTLLLAPATATYHFVLLWLPVGLLVDYFFRRRTPMRAYFILGIYALIGFFPYKFTIPFEGRGGLTVLAYPRLFLLLTMFGACVYFVWNRADPAREQRTHDSPAMVI